MHRFAVSLSAALFLASSTSAGNELVVSIKPLALIAGAILGDHGSIRTLIPADTSPHHYTLRPSDRLALESADLIVYVGEELETEFHAVIENLGAHRPVLTLLSADGLERRPLASAHSPAQDATADRYDPHIWLDPHNGLKIAALIRDRLLQMDPGAAPDYQANYQRLATTLSDQEQLWRVVLDSLPAVPYGVYHDGIGYFESRFNRRHVLALVDDPEVQPGIRHMLRIRDAIDTLRPVCLFTDITARGNTVETLLAGRPVRRTELDLLGSRLDAGAGYPELLGTLVDDYRHCLAGGESQ